MVVEVKEELRVVGDLMWGARGWIRPVRMGVCLCFRFFVGGAVSGVGDLRFLVGRRSGRSASKIFFPGVGEAGSWFTSASLPSTSKLPGVKTIQINPTNLPLQHSCLYAIISQNWSNVLTDFHIPVPLFFGLVSVALLF